MVKTRVSMIISVRHLQREDMFVVTESDKPSKSVCSVSGYTDIRMNNLFRKYAGTMVIKFIN